VIRTTASPSCMISRGSIAGPRLGLESVIKA
jgi:hypothetical protein